MEKDVISMNRYKNQLIEAIAEIRLYPSREAKLKELLNGCGFFEVDKKELEASLKRMTIMIDIKVARVIFKLQSGVLTIISPESELGTADEEIPCQYDGPDVTMALNYIYIEEPLKVIPTERITFEFTEAMKAITLRPEPESDYFHIIMPMNLD